MRSRYFMLVMAGTMAMPLLPIAAQMVPAKPNTVREQISQTAPGKPAATAVPAVQAAPKAPAVPAAGGAKRDPFDPLLGKPNAQGAPGPDRLPPGKAGLVIGTMRLDGLVHGPNGMLAVVSNPQQRVYFLREGDRIFDGQVTRITMEAVSFQQSGRDAFGNTQEHEVTRRLYPNPGEQR